MLSSDATLSSLTLRAAFSFDPTTGVNVDHVTDRTTVTATTNHAAGRRYRNGTIDTVDLTVGTTTIIIIVPGRCAEPPPVLATPPSAASHSAAGVHVTHDVDRFTRADARP